MNIFCKIHSHSEGNVLAVCDAEVLGKSFEEGKYFLEVKEAFYKGTEIGEEELVEKLKEFANVNLVGEECVGIALKNGFASEKNVIRIKGIPHLQIFKM